MSMPPLNDRRRLLRGTAALALGTPAMLKHALSEAQEAAFPNRPVHFVVPFAAGSGTDITARTYAKAISDLTGHSVVVENKAGANGIIGVKTVLSAPADGYTVFFASNSTLTANAALLKQLPYDPVRDFDMLGGLDASNCMLVVPAASRYRTLADLVNDARARPGRLNNAAGSAMYGLWNAWFNELADVKTVNIFYKGSGEAVTAAASGQVDYSIVAGGAITPMLQGGRIRALLYAGSGRHPLVPDVPTSADAGMPDFQARAWTASAVRSGTPLPIQRDLEQLFARAGKHPDVLRAAEAQGAEIMMLNAAAMRRFQVDEINRWKRLVAATGITIE